MPVLTAENLSKKFVIAHESRERYTALRDVMARGAKKIFSFPGSLWSGSTSRATKEEFWALKGLNFEINQGDRVGIIGRNGAGKSTLLKILSRITPPTEGRVTIKGRVASLLEVGTGFHPELTGRENIFLNGAILGMSQAEIRKKFDEIVAFAEVEKFLDTPVKRYSSGMYVRLAFSVAAHLEPEILIVDEVLAVGDLKFQKKCLGKMEDVSREGRTIFFVSHQLDVLSRLCNNGLYLEAGKLIGEGSISTVIHKYLSQAQNTEAFRGLEQVKRPDIPLAGNIMFKDAKIVTGLNHCQEIPFAEKLKFKIDLDCKKPVKNLEIGLALFTHTDFELVSSVSSDERNIGDIATGLHTAIYEFEDLLLLPNKYQFSLGLRSEHGFEDYLPLVGRFEVLFNEQAGLFRTGTRKGVIIPKIKCIIG